METTHKPAERRDAPEHYQFRVKENLDRKWRVRFEGLNLTHEQDGTTLSGLLPDQAALHGVLRKIRDSGLTLIAVVQVPCEAVEPREVDLEQGGDRSGP